MPEPRPSLRTPTSSSSAIPRPRSSRVRWRRSSYVGPVLYNETDKFKKLDFGELDKLAADSHRKLPYTRNTDNGWVGMIEHYFVTAWLPGDEKRTAREFYAQRVDGGLYRVGVILPVGAIAPGATGEIRVPLYAGPQEQEALAALAKGLDLVVDYGIFTVIAAPLFWLVKWLHSLLHNWGWAIIAMTILIKTAFYPLNHASARSMAKMKVIGPKLKALQEQYKDDKQQLQARMMEMYKQEKINPLGGCLPIVVQIPVFLALYWVLLSAVELRHAPWIGWIQDLSAPDPWYRAAGDLRDHRLPAGQVVADADFRSGAGQGHADHADRVFGDVRVLPLRARPLLAHQQLHPDLPAVAHEPSPRKGSGRRGGQASLRHAADTAAAKRPVW